jgi:hypothetical protein
LGKAVERVRVARWPRRRFVKESLKGTGRFFARPKRLAAREQKSKAPPLLEPTAQGWATRPSRHQNFSAQIPPQAPVKKGGAKPHGV